MSAVIQFPAPGRKVALYTSSHMYVGTIAESQPILDRPGIWLTDASIMPIKGQVTPEEVLQLDSVLVLWDRVTALSDCPGFGRAGPV